jgi:hypothetical protein
MNISNDTCPYSAMPNTEFETEFIVTLASQKALTAYTFDCNLFKLNNCQINPPWNDTLLDLGNDAVCAIYYQKENDGTANAISAYCEGACYKPTRLDKRPKQMVDL